METNPGQVPDPDPNPSPLSKNIYLAFPCLQECLSVSYKQILNSNCRLPYYCKQSLWTTIRQIFSPIESTLFQNFPQWHFLQEQDEGRFCSHTFATMLVLSKDPEFLVLNENDSNILMWTMLFHDIFKRGPPLIRGRDPFHPFTSACVALGIFREKGFVEEREGFEEFKELIESCFTINMYGDQIMDYTRLDEVFRWILFLTGVWERVDQDLISYREVEMDIAEDKRFAFEIIILILFHQSLDINPFYPNPSFLNQNQILKYLSLRIVKFLHIVHKADHNSYNIGVYEFGKWPNDIKIEKEVVGILKLLES